MEVLIAAMTILGGLAALWFFWDKIVARFGSSSPQEPCSPQEAWVGFSYPTDSGLQQRLENDGYEVVWCRDSKLLQRTETDGYEVVKERGPEGNARIFKLKGTRENQTLLKRKRSQP